jgi:cytochrome c-type biogenesis protein CcmH/NrfG
MGLLHETLALSPHTVRGTRKYQFQQFNPKVQRLLRVKHLAIRVRVSAAGDQWLLVLYVILGFFLLSSMVAMGSWSLAEAHPREKVY